MRSQDPIGTALKITASSPPGLEINLLGRFEWLQNGLPLPRTRTRTEQHLLALLLLRRGQKIDRVWLAGTFWPDSREEQALNNLRRSLSTLRQALGAEEAVRLMSPTPRTIAFDSSELICDVFLFDAALQASDIASQQRALTLYQGPLLPDCDAAWLLPERHARETSYLNTLETVARHCLQSGQTDAALSYLGQALTADPYRESAFRLQLEALVACGNQAGMTQAYRRFRLLLHENLQTTPDRETVLLYQRLQGAGEGKSGEGIAGQRGILGTSLGVPVYRSLPTFLAPLIGRTEERTAVGSLLATARLVTLIGPGGVGKTRLAVAIAEAVAAGYQEGVAFVDLTPTSDAETLLKAVADVVGIRTDSDLTPKEALRRFLARKSLLLILDNAEHVLRPCAEASAFLLSQCPGLHILCTSREPLHISGEQVRQVGALETPPSEGMVEGSLISPTQLLLYDAVALLVERAAAASGTFRFTASNAAAVVQICRRLDGIPLALELVAARFRSLSAQEIAGRLGGFFGLLASGDPTSRRHHTLGAAIEWSYSLLSMAEQQLLRELSVFVGGWTLSAAEAICSAKAEAVLPLLLSLLEKSLVVYDVQEEQGRYRLLEMTRQYGMERLTPEERKAQRERHAAFFLDLVREEKPNDPEWRTLYNRVRADHDNLRAAHAWWKEHEPDTALWLEYRLYLFDLEKPGDWRERIARLTADPLPPSLLSLLITFQTGCWAMWRGYPEGELLLQRVVEMASICGKPRWKMSALTTLSALERERGDDARVLAYAEAALISAQEYGDLYAIVTIEMLVCEMLARTGAVAEAKRRVQAQLERGRRDDDPRILLPTLNWLAESAYENRAWESARAYWEEALAMARTLQPDGLPNQLRNLAYVAREQQDYEAAWQFLEQSIVASRRNRAPDREAWIRWDMAETAYRQGDISLALEQLRLCLGLFRDNEEARSVTQCLRKAARFHSAAGDYERAALLLGSVERRIRELVLELPLGEQEAYQALGADLRASMGTEAWQAAFARGQAFNFSDAEALAFVPTNFSVGTGSDH